MQFQEALKRIREIAQSLPEDDPDRSEMMEVEGDYSKLIEWALRKRKEYVAQAEAAKDLVETYKKRQNRFEDRADNFKQLTCMIMDAAGETKYQGVSGTVTIKAVPPKPVVTDESKIPDNYIKTTTSIDKAAINAAVKNGASIPGVSMDNGGVTTQIRTD